MTTEITQSNLIIKELSRKKILLQINAKDIHRRHNLTNFVYEE